MRKFLEGDVEVGKFGSAVTVKWKQGSPVIMKVFDANGEQIAKEVVEKYDREEMVGIVEKYGFRHEDTESREMDTALESGKTEEL
mmetsp:Transcript_38926/g.110185  ORF Transcript_38926/g.110185 Transcript_38926/m.110185 type:complete len:85 (+) Transcript_38926:264-518(+)